MKSPVKALEGLLGLGGGGLGLALTFALSLVRPRALDFSTAYASSVSYDSPGALTPQLFAVLSGLPIIAASIFFAGAIAGTWLDLSGQRRAGKQLLIVCLIGLLVAMWTMLIPAFTMLFYVALCFMPVVGATIIASLRSEPSAGA